MIKIFTIATFWNLLGLMLGIDTPVIILNFIILLCAYKYGLEEGK